MTAIFQLLRILQEETDPQHRLSQQQLLRRMQTRFGVTLNRRTLKRHLDLLCEVGFPLNADRKPHSKPDGTAYTRDTDWYMEPQLELSELRLLLDLLNAMPALPERQRDAVANKLCRLAPHTAMYHVQDAVPPVVHLHHPPAKQLLYSVELLCEAIRKNCMVEFQYCGCRLSAEGKIEPAPRCDDEGAPRIYRVSPYRILVSQGRYYLVCRKEPYQSVSHYRIDRILELRLLPDEPGEPVPEKLRNPSRTIEQLYMYSGDQVTCRFLADARIMGDIADWFGDSACIVPAEKPGLVTVTVQVHPLAMEHWALQYARWVTVLEPASLCADLAETAALLAVKYPSESDEKCPE